jgi:SAM-dependent methyltransferase
MAAGSESPVATHYGRPGIVEAIDAALAAAGKSPDAIRIEDLAPVDNFHLRGLEATRELAQLAGVAGTGEVLDIGGGIGGPARMLAATFGCRVTVLDLTPEFCWAGEELTRRMGLDDRVKFRLGDALQPPFPAASFDLVWTQHSSMNMPDKPALYAAARRLLRQGGRLAVHEIMGGLGGPIEFPVPWASRAELSFLLPADEVRGIIRDAGFRERTWVDVSAASLAWIDERLAATERPPLGPHVRLGEGARVPFENLRRGLAEDRVRVIESVFD